MRAVAGTARRLLLKTPDGYDTRPTSGRIKETLFNMLMPYLPGAVFVDLFAGSGGIGIEALSRGAAKAYFVENSNKAFECIMYNLEHTHLREKAVALKQDVFSAIRGSIKDTADIVFLDPPYNQEYERRVLEILREAPFINEDTLIIVEVPLRNDMEYAPDFGFEIIKQKKYKTNKHIFIKKSADN